MGYGDVKWGVFLHLSAIIGEDMSLINSKLEVADLLMEESWRPYFEL